MANRRTGTSVPALPLCLINQHFAVAPSASRADVLRQLDSRLAQLTSLLSITYGVHGTMFREELDSEFQENFMWVCGDLASESQDLLSAVCAMQRVEGEAK